MNLGQGNGAIAHVSSRPTSWENEAYWIDSHMLDRRALLEQFNVTYHKKPVDQLSELEEVHEWRLRSCDI